MSTQKYILFLWISFFSLSNAQTTQDTTKLETLRTQSGVDPTRVVSKLVYSVWFYDKSDNRSQINNRLNFTIGVNRWSFSVKPELITKNDVFTNQQFVTKAGDLRFSILNAFYVHKKHALAAAAEFTLPTGSPFFGSQFFAVNPSITYSYTFNQSLFIAFQPQYLFDIANAEPNQNLSVLTLRTFLAKFLPSGWFFVFEPRVVQNFETDTVDFILVPIAGKSLGGGFNITSVIEYALKETTRKNNGFLIQFGITKNF